MKTEVIMPQMGESIAEGTIVTWFKNVGDPVKRDEMIFEISTDKVDVEIPAPVSGYLAQILYGPGKTVEVNTVVAYISETLEGVGQSASPAPASAGAATAVPAPQQPQQVSGAKTEATIEDLRRSRSSPLVRKMAAEHGVDISQMPGSGISGRVTKKDFLAFVSQPTTETLGAPPAKAAALESAKVRSGKFDHMPSASDRVEPFSAMRSSIAEHMVISRETSVHVSTVFEVDMTRVVKLRAALRDKYAQRGVNLTYMPFIIKAVCEGLREFPILNSSILNNQIYYRQDINIGMAVALDWGLLVPVIKRADEQSLQGLSRSVADLAERARTKKLAPDDVQGGTFTITNPGVFGSLFGTPIINQPQVAILGVGAIVKRPVVIEDDAIAVRHMQYLVLSFDHRLIDGATADRFMGKVKHILQNFPTEAT